MRISEIHIEEFGKLRERSFRFGEGINVIFGANESGKSTLLAFLRFAFVVTIWQLLPWPSVRS